MKRPVRSPIDGTYTVHGKKYKELFGSREQVMNETAYKTTGGLTTEDLLMNKNGRIVSSTKYKTAKKERRLEKYGYFAKKGKFGYVKRGKTGKSKVSLNSTKSNKVDNGKAVIAPVPPSSAKKTRKRKMKGGDDEEKQEEEMKGGDDEEKQEEEMKGGDEEKEEMKGGAKPDDAVKEDGNK